MLDLFSSLLRPPWPILHYTIALTNYQTRPQCLCVVLYLTTKARRQYYATSIRYPTPRELDPTLYSDQIRAVPGYGRLRHDGHLDDAVELVGEEVVGFLDVVQLRDTEGGD